MLSSLKHHSKILHLLILAIISTTAVSLLAVQFKRNADLQNQVTKLTTQETDLKAQLATAKADIEKLQTDDQ